MKTFATSIAAVLTLLVANLCFAQPQNQTILLRNVSLISPETGEVLTVNLLIKNQLLDLMSEDSIPRSEADVTYDAGNGFILGPLKLGEPASFMILRGDPREDMEVLLDTKSSATFAVRKGTIVVNRFGEITVDKPGEEELPGGWLAYSPPPLAVPLDYQDTSRWNRWETKYFSGIFAGAVVLDRQYWTDQDSNSVIQVGDLSSYDGGEIRGLRFGGVGTLNFEKPWVWTLFGATHAFDKGFDTDETDEATLFDVRLDIPLWEKTSFSIGKQKEPISMERIMSMAYLPMQERTAAADALLPSRNVGVVMASTFFDDRVTLAGGVFNDWLDKDQPNSISDNGTQLVGRATWVAWESSDQGTLLHLGGGLRQSNAREGGVGKSEPEFNQAPSFVETPFLDPDNFDTYQAEASLRSGPFWLHGEYISNFSDGTRYGDLRFGGYHVMASWVLTGEMRPYNKRVGIFGKVPIARSVDQNGWGAWEIGTRFSHVDLSDRAVDGGEMDIWSAGINWWLSPYMNVNLNYRYITLDRFGIEGSSQGFNSRLVLLLE